MTRPRIIALLSWYDEPIAWLERCITSLTRAGVTDLVAVDGAYALYPDAQPSSDPLQRLAICNTAHQHGIRYRIHTPPEAWAGNEVHKRNFLFEYAETQTRPQPGDWYLVIDADEHIIEAPQDVPARLAGSPFDVAAVTLREPGHPLGTMIYPTHPKFFRAIKGLRTVTNHYTYTLPDGRKLWGNAKTDRLEPRHDLTTVTVEHCNQLRHTDRRSNALAYYRTRDQAGIEDLPAERSLLQDAA